MNANWADTPPTTEGEQTRPCHQVEQPETGRGTTGSPLGDEKVLEVAPQKRRQHDAPNISATLCFLERAPQKKDGSKIATVFLRFV
ncbi:MAG: hypothetical protein IKH14_08265 [Prevotella sp.]|nr:hypothetical protein [Prevotella sp.]